MHRRIVSELRCKPSDLSAAVERLIEDGVFLRQKDGVLYDTEGNVVSFDPESVDPGTLQLRRGRA